MRGRIEAEIIGSGLWRIAGIDEVGRGCIAGPVYAGCAILDYQRLHSLKKSQKNLIRDSKTLSHKQRQAILPVIQDVAIDTGVGIGSVEEINQHGIVGAIALAMQRALASCSNDIDLLLVDGKHAIKGIDFPQRPIIGGDNLCFAIAAGAILAKEARDAYMHAQAAEFPQYGFDSHVGYGTRQHLESLRKYGPCTLHRSNFAPVTQQIQLFSAGRSA